MGDGAHLGVGAERALGTILGGEPSPDESEQETPEHVRARILAAVERGGDPTGYGDCADIVAGMVLKFYDKRPEARQWPVEREGRWQKDGVLHEKYVKGADYVPIGPDLYGEVKAFSDGKLDNLGITGFQWGWAVNAARYASSLPPEPNPALMTVGRAD